MTYQVICRDLFVVNELRWDEIVCFVEIGKIVDHHCLKMVVYFVEIGEIVDYHCLEVIVCFVEIGEIVDYHCFRGDCFLCWNWWNCWPSLFRDDCLFCWYCLNCWSSLFINILFCDLIFIPCFDGGYDFRIKLCAFCLYLQLFVRGLTSYLRYVCLFVYGGVSFVLFVVILCLAFPMLPISLDCPLLYCPFCVL